MGDSNLVGHVQSLIAFDLDGTLIDSHRDLAESANQLISELGGNPLSEVAAFRAFQEGVNDRCDEPPVPVGLREVGSYRFWSE